MTATNPIVVTGAWPDGKTVKDFFTDLDLTIPKEAYQLFQTWSECRLERFNPDTELDPKYIDQYRAFCPIWELWIRNINAKELRFRLISAINVDEIKIVRDGFAVEKEALQNTHIETVAYPLWGELLKGEENIQGWYTQEIPKVLNYPVDKPWNEVAVEVENFMRPDGTVEMARYCSLVRFEEKTSKAGGNYENLYQNKSK